jgi:hypothetical protein
MIKVNRRYIQRGTVPCEGSYQYQAETCSGEYVLKTAWMSEKEYYNFKQKEIQENWK